LRLHWPVGFGRCGLATADAIDVVTRRTEDNYMDVGVRDLKRKLSEYLERAARGEVIRVTDRGQPKALLGPLPQGPNLDPGVAEGWIRPGRDVPPSPAVRSPAERRVGDVLTEDRDT
jgi:prevent-host-death family protein